MRYDDIVFGLRSPAQGGGIIAFPYRELPHIRVVGTTGSGKSTLLECIAVSTIMQGYGIAVLDPSGEMSPNILKRLVALDYYTNSPDAFERVLFLDIPTASERGLFLPFNVLRGNYDAYAAAEIVLESFKRIWPALLDGTSTNIDTLVKLGAFVLAHHRLPLLPYFEEFYTVPQFQKRLLAGVNDKRIEKWLKILRVTPTEKFVPEIALTTLKREILLSFNPTLYYALAQQKNILDLNELITQKRAVILNLNVDNSNTQRLLGSLFTTQAEQVTITRGRLPEPERQDKYGLVIDEVQDHVEQAGKAIRRMLAQARKANVSLVLANQYEEQLPDDFRAALSQVGIIVVFHLGEADAGIIARTLGFPIYANRMKQVSDPFAPGGVRKQFMSADEQWDEYAQRINHQQPREAFIRLLGNEPYQMSTIEVRKYPDTQQIADIQEEYLRRYFTSKADIDREQEATVGQLYASQDLGQNATLHESSPTTSRRPSTPEIKHTQIVTPPPDSSPAVSEPQPAVEAGIPDDASPTQTPGTEMESERVVESRPVRKLPEDEHEFF